MITLSWNCRGLARATATRTLRAIIRDIVDLRGKKGGLVVGWKIGVDMEITFKSSNIINGLIFFDSMNEPWLISFVYGPPNHNNRGLFWEAIEMVGDAFNGGWLCIGDSTMYFPKLTKKAIN